MKRVPEKASRTNISADADREAGYSLNFLGAIWWFLRCFINNSLPAKKTALLNLRIRDYRPTNIEVSEIDSTKSPGRFLLDRFLEEFPWQRAVEQIGPISVIDLGCGNGEYTERIGKLLGKQLRVAHGLDLLPHANWKTNARQNVHFQLVQKESLNLPEHNFVMTLTALEHIRFDAGVVEIITDHSNRNANQSIQLHIVPAPRSLFLYLTHGYRQYSVPTIAKLFSSGGMSGKITVFGLGGSATARVHARWIRNGLFSLRENKKTRDPIGYRKALGEALSHERKSRRMGAPIYYAVVVEESSETGLFD